ncbi:MAG: MarR family transcriptional regulator [Anaerolineales bacterium]|nr:MarR family transcriptional regulator [Anaerolineales bacterium]
MPTHHNGTREETQALNAFIKFTRANNALMSRLFRRGTMEPLTESQFAVLEALYHLGPLCQGEISKKILRSGGNITLVIDNLEKQGWARRERDTEDRRLVRVSLTPHGRQTIEDVFPRHVQAIVEEMKVLSPAEKEQLSELCKKLGKGECQSHDDGGV